MSIKCSKNTCLGLGCWVPILVVFNKLKTDWLSSPIKFDEKTPLILCDQCKREITPNKLLGAAVIKSIVANCVKTRPDFKPEISTVSFGWELLPPEIVNQTNDKKPTRKRTSK